MAEYTTQKPDAQGVHITSLELENVKKIKAVALEPAPTGLTVIGGRNGAGKTSVLDAIAWALGGEKFRPDAAKRSGSVLDPVLRVQLSNGLTVTRKGTKSALTVTDTTGRRSGQQLLNEFVEVLALDLPRFLGATDKERAGILLGILGIQDQLDVLEREERAKYDTRLQIGRDRDQARHHAESLEWYPDAGEAVSVADLTEELKKAQAVNAENLALRQKAESLDRQQRDLEEKIREMAATLTTVREERHALIPQLERLVNQDEGAILERIRAADEINTKVRANAMRTEADQRASLLADEYESLTGEIEEVRARRAALLEGADMPLPGLSVQEGVLTYQGQPWSCMSSAEQLRAATAIVARLKPECRFVLVDKLEQMDTDTLREFGAWAADQGLQVIGTRVSTGEECTILIEDGCVAQKSGEDEQTAQTWKAGTF